MRWHRGQTAKKADDRGGSKCYNEKKCVKNAGGSRMDRFKKVYQQGAIDVVEIWVDTETGVNYLFHRNGNAGGLTPLLDKEGNPVVTK